MSGQQPSEKIADYVARSRAEQGLPPKVDDPAVIRKIARLIIRARDRQQRGAA